jgi:hypothetical protein
MSEYKSLTKENKGPYSDFDFTAYLPKGKHPGKWLPKVDCLELCVSGWHGCRDGDILNYLDANIYEIETRGEILTDEDKFSVQRIRLLRKCENWNERTALLFACDCAERVLPIFEKEFPDDKRPRIAIETARQYANGKATTEELDAAWVAAWDAAWAAKAAGAAAEAARAAGWAARAAGEAAGWAAGRAAVWAAKAAEAARAAVWAARNAEKKWQTNKLLILLKKKDRTHQQEWTKEP